MRLHRAARVKKERHDPRPLARLNEPADALELVNLLACVTQNGIYRRTLAGTYPSTPSVKIPAGTSYTDNGLTSKTTYCYEVTAFAGGGESSRSSEACAMAK